MTVKKERKKTLLKTLPTKFGITDKILQDLMKYDIMFPIMKRTKPNGKEDYFVYEDDVIFLINRMLENQMAAYKLVNDANEAAKKVEKILEEAPTLSELEKELEDKE